MSIVSDLIERPPLASYVSPTTSEAGSVAVPDGVTMAAPSQRPGDDLRTGRYRSRAPRPDPMLHNLTATVETVRQRLRTLGDGIEIGRVRLGEHLSAGKLLRGSLVLAAATFGGPPDLEQALRYAVLVELIHAGALLHDDVMDRCTLRRGQPTVWSRVGDRSAVLAGAALIVRAGGALAEAPEWLRRQVGEALRDVARGQTDELMELFSTRCRRKPISAAHTRRPERSMSSRHVSAPRLGPSMRGPRRRSGASRPRLDSRFS